VDATKMEAFKQDQMTIRKAKKRIN